jgi:hypothetical protein
MHVMPIADLIEHTASEDCSCGPNPERVTNAGGGDAWLYVHHSLDGRERAEEA